MLALAPDSGLQSQPPIRVLVIEDDGGDAMIARHLLAEVADIEYFVDWAKTAEAGVAAAQSGAFDVCLLDFHLGLVTGLEVLAELQAKGCDLPVILLTGYRSRAIDLQAMAAGASDYLPKGDLSPDLLERSIRYAMERKRTERALEDRVRERTRELEEEVAVRRRAELRADEANRAKSDFLANMSHELRTPLNAIIGFSEVMLQEIFGPIGDSRYRTYLGDIHHSGAHLLAIINDILDLAKIEAGRLELQVEPTDADALARRAIAFVASRARDGRVELCLELPPDLPLLPIDPRRMSQVLINLLSNAVKFTRAEGRVTLTVETSADGGFSFTVADTGIGMSHEDLALAVQPFRQVDNGLTRRYDGTGLGLPLAKSLVEMQGGRMDITSTPGTGTTVRVAFAPALHRR